MSRHGHDFELSGGAAWRSEVASGRFLVSPSERRERLLEWMRAYKLPQRAVDLVYGVSAYDIGHRDWTSLVALCRADLRHLEREGRVCRHRGSDPEGRPHTWEVVR